MKSPGQVIFICFYLFLPAGLTQASPPTAKELLSEADADYAQRVNISKVREAIVAYQKALAADPGSYETAWRLARSYLWLGDNLPKADRLPLFNLGKAAAEKAVQITPGRVEGHFWLGACLGRIGEEKGGLGHLAMVDPIARQMEIDLRLNPHYAPAEYVLGVLYREAPGWPFSRGNLQKSLAFAQAAAADEPDIALNHIGLAETWLALNQKASARKELALAIGLPGRVDLQPETAKDKALAREILAHLR